MKKTPGSNNGHTKDRESNAQMILLTGVMIAVLIIAMSSISVNLANVGVELSLERSISPLDEYINVRHIFINVFNNSCAGHSDDDIVWSSFSYTKKILSNIEIRYGNYFNAELDYNEGTSVASVYLSLICKNTCIEEEIRMQI